MFYTVGFIFYSLLLVIFSLLLLYLLSLSPLILILGAIPNGFLHSIFGLIKILILPITCEICSIYIWVKVLNCLQASKPNYTFENKKYLISMTVLIVILSVLLLFFAKTIHSGKKNQKRYEKETKQQMQELERKSIESNKDAAANCINVEGLCVTRKRISYKRGDTLKESINIAEKTCSELGMRLPTKEEFDVILLPLTSFKNKLENNLSAEEFVEMERYYTNVLEEYHLQFWGDNFLTSSIENGKAITYKVNLKYNHDDCRSVHTKDVSGRVCIRTTIDTPIIEHHDFYELKDKSKYLEYSLHCVK